MGIFPDPINVLMTRHMFDNIEDHMGGAVQEQNTVIDDDAHSIGVNRRKPGYQTGRQGPLLKSGRQDASFCQTGRETAPALAQSRRHSFAAGAGMPGQVSVIIVNDAPRRLVENKLPDFGPVAGRMNRFVMMSASGQNASY